MVIRFPEMGDAFAVIAVVERRTVGQLTRDLRRAYPIRRVLNRGRRVAAKGTGATLCEG